MMLVHFLNVLNQNSDHILQSLKFVFGELLTHDFMNISFAIVWSEQALWPHSLGWANT